MILGRRHEVARATAELRPLILVTAVAVVVDLTVVITRCRVYLGAQIACVRAAGLAEREKWVDVRAAALAAHWAKITEVDDGHRAVTRRDLGERLGDDGKGKARGGQQLPRVNDLVEREPHEPRTAVAIVVDYVC